jgi:hypothetical protein
MTESNSNDRDNTKEAKLPRRDWILLPMLGLITVCLMIGSAELIARRMFSYSSTGLKDCTVLDDSLTVTRGIPNCVSWEKGYEYQPVEYRFNRMGYRADTEFGPKRSGTYRIVMLGSSIPMGFGVESEKSFAALLPGELSLRTGHRVELFNEAIAGSGGVSLRLGDALAANPDMILWVLTPWDIEQGSSIVHHVKKADRNVTFTLRALRRVKSTFDTTSLTSAVEKTFNLTRTALLMRHFLFESQSQFVKAYLMGSDDEAGFLKSEPSPEWIGRLDQLSTAAAQNGARAKAAGVPIVAVLVPNRAEAAMISMGEWPYGYDPYKLGDEMRSVITSHGGTYIDILPAFRSIPNPERYYFPVDGHINAEGHAILSKLLAKELTNGAVRGFIGAPQPPLIQAQER